MGDRVDFRLKSVMINLFKPHFPKTDDIYTCDIMHPSVAHFNRVVSANWRETILEELTTAPGTGIRIHVPTYLLFARYTFCHHKKSKI
jgi:hypothetical protein